jgi:N-acyl-D-aspartate/D-glutamate deacylase
MHDLVIRGGTIVDGTGAEKFVADIGVDDGKITAIGEVGAGHREIDATGKLVTPGFVDVHTHYDAQVTWDPYLTPSSWHGVTTVIMGSCGVGFAPVKSDQHDWLIGLMEGVEDIPGSALSEGIQWQWETFPEYMDALEGKERAVDFGVQIPHGALRTYVMGERGVANEEATAEDIEKMKALVKEALEAGAFGFSTSRTSLHKSIEGDPVPGTFATRDELFGIGEAFEETGWGVYQLACEHSEVPAEMDWMEELARKIKRPVSFNLSQFDQAPQLWRDVASRLDKAADTELYAQVAGRGIGILQCWRGTAHPFAGCTSWLEVSWLPWEETLEKLKDPERRAKIIAEVPPDLGEFGNFVTRTWDKMFPQKDGVEYEPSAEQSIAAIAEAEGKTPAEVAYDYLMENEGQGILYFPLFNYSEGNLDVLHKLHQHPRTRMGLSDAGAHCGAICDGGMPTFMLTHWARDRTRGDKLPLEYVVHRQTQQTAEFFGMYDRGVIKPGYRADLNVIDFDNLGFERPHLAWDLPAGGRRFVQRSRGYDATLVAGVVVSKDGELTGALPGRLLRGEQQAPRS